MQVEAFLEGSAERFPEKTGLVCGERRLTYRQLEEQSNQLAHVLITMGVRRADNVAVFLDNTVEAVLSVFAILKVGAAFIMISPTTKSEKLTYILKNSGARALITASSKAAAIQDCWKEAPELKGVLIAGRGAEKLSKAHEQVVSWDHAVSRHKDRIQPPPKRAIDVDMAALIYTSGSTGSPKGVVVSHLNMVATATSISTYLENKAEDIILNVLPLSFGYGLYQILTAFKVGATVILERSFTYPHAVLKRLVEERVTGFPIVPTISAILLQMDLAQYSFPCLRYVTNAGAAMPTPHLLKLVELFPRTRIYSMYGLTECQRVSYLAPDQVQTRPGSVGKAMPNVEVYVVDDTGQQLPPGNIGELVVRGSNVMKGYWKLPDETARALTPGPLPGDHVLHTGDLFRMDDEGYLYWVGRTDDIIKSRGEKVSPKEVENVLYGLEGVAMAVVFGVCDPVFGQAVKAVIKLKEGVHLGERDILRHCAQHLEDFMVPKIIEFRETMPTTASGKIDKRELALSHR